MNRRDFILTTAAAMATGFIPVVTPRAVCEPETTFCWSHELAVRIRDDLHKRSWRVESVLVLSPRMAVGYKQLVDGNTCLRGRKRSAARTERPNCTGYTFCGKRIVIDTSPSAPAWRWEYAVAGA